MAAIKLPSARKNRLKRLICLAGPFILITLCYQIGTAPEAQPLSSKAVQWYEDDRHLIPEPAERDPNLLWDMVEDSFFLPLGRVTDPGRLTRRLGTLFGADHVAAAANLNTLDEVPNSTWFTNRIGLYPLDAAEVACGPCRDGGPDQSAPWLVISAKTQGVTPGFVIKDPSDRIWLIKFDPPGYLGMTTGAGVISNRILHASGYNVPEDIIVRFQASDLILADDVKLKLPDGTKRLMTNNDLARIIDLVEKPNDGTIHAIASRFLPGKPIGPFNYVGRRHDDANDRIDHRRRRELRGLRLFSAWINHFDTKQHNSLDMFVSEGDSGYVRHYLIDFASTLGAAANGATPRYGYEFSLDLPPTLGRILALGFHDDAWRYLTRPPGLPEIGYFESALFDPLEFKSLQPNSAFADMTIRDGYWAAKIISTFTDEQLSAIVAEAGFQSPDAESYMARILGERRDKIARQIFDRMPPLDFFLYRNSKIHYVDLGAERNIYPEYTHTYRTRFAFANEKGNHVSWSKWQESSTTDIPLPSDTFSDMSRTVPPEIKSYPFLAVQAAVNRGDDWSRSITAYFYRPDGRTVAIKR